MSEVLKNIDGDSDSWFDNFCRINDQKQFDPKQAAKWTVFEICFYLTAAYLNFTCLNCNALGR